VNTDANFDLIRASLGICAPFCHLQTPKLAIARPGAIEETVDQSVKTGTAYYGRQSSPLRFAGAGTNPAMDAIHQTSRDAPPRNFPE
jgi:hypothetical protein